MQGHASKYEFEQLEEIATSLKNISYIHALVGEGILTYLQSNVDMEDDIYDDLRSIINHLFNMTDKSADVK
jgi:hypothetical protein